MADADVPITAGAGTKIDTRTVGAGTDEHRQVVCVGDPATAANVLVVSSTGAVLAKGDQPAATVGTIGSAVATVQATVTSYANVTITVSGTHAGINLTFEASDDSGTTWFAFPFQRESDGAVVLTTGVLTSNSATMYSASAPGVTTVRVRATAWTSGGTNSVRITAGAMGLEPIVSIGNTPTVAQGTAAAAAGAWPAKVTDGTNVAAVKAASTAAVAADPAAVVSVSPNSPLPTGTNTIGKADQGAPATQANAWFVRPRKLISYRAMYRTTTAPYALSQALVASTRKQFATIHHAASATKTVRVKGAWFLLSSSNAAALTAVDFVRITAAPVTPNPAITPNPADPADAAAEATCMCLPTTAGTEVAVNLAYSSRLLSGGISAPATNPNDIAITAIDLLQMGNGNEYDHENKPPVIRAGVLEGYAVTLTSTGAPTVGGYVIIDFTEE